MMKKLYKVLMVSAIVPIVALYFIYWSPPCIHSKGIRPYSLGGVYCDRVYSARPNKTSSKSTERVNIVLLGVEGRTKADTIIFMSFNKEINKLNMISIPGETYYNDKEHNALEQRKLYSVYEREKEDGCVSAVREILRDVPVDCYISIDYEGVEKIIDSVGGVEVEVPFDLDAGGIKISKGKQVLCGKEVFRYLRYREDYPGGDIGRAKEHQKLISAALAKMELLGLPKTISKIMGSIRTDMTIGSIVDCAGGFRKIAPEDVSISILPGALMYKYINGVNCPYYFHNPQKVKEMIDNIYETENIEQKKRRLRDPGI